MKLTVEISMYPLAANYLEPIRAFIAQLNSYEGIQVSTYPTATVLVGDHDVVMEAFRHALRWSQETFGMCVFVSKFITGYEAE
jgi:uncharacterized protein YqgV (UPF0045/DUF77 family)